MTQTVRDLDWQRIAEAFVHPAKIAILDGMRDGESHAPSDLARALELKLGDVSYHMKELESAGMVDLVTTQPGRSGTIKRLYRIRKPGPAPTGEHSACRAEDL